MWEQKRGKVDFTDDVVSSTIVFYLNKAEDTLRFSISDTQGGTQEDATEKTTEKTTEKIMLAIQNNPRITNRELAELLGLTEDRIFWNIKNSKRKASSVVLVRTKAVIGR